MNKQHGFSLIELMIAVAIVGILMGVAMPSYKQFVDRGRIADAEQTITRLGMAMEKHNSMFNTYEGAAISNQAVGTIDQNKLTSIDSEIQNYYDFTILQADRLSYVLLAKPASGKIEIDCSIVEYDVIKGLYLRNKSDNKVCDERG